ncbi:MAG: hypothetical protein HKP41_19440 [Desulfobacterales bacterium]|nr:hypothetical protein [Deltaproteobacteria bacterium]NNK96526.1 hypothetical protein [Desulfobacterales bacterium]
MPNINITIHQNVPSNPDSSKQYLFYLHGLIVEEAGLRPKSEEHGYYEYELMLNKLAQEGFIVISEAREKGTRVKPYAEKVASQVKQLLADKVPPENISIVGASKGGLICAYVSYWLKEKEIKYAFLSGLFEKYLQDEELKLYGNVLSIHDRSDKLSINPLPYFQRSEGLGQFEHLVLDLDLGHGLIYQPHKEWLEPLVYWLKNK